VQARKEWLGGVECKTTVQCGRFITNGGDDDDDDGGDDDNNKLDQGGGCDDKYSLQDFRPCDQSH
jgi:hypothetical protein